MAQVRAFFKSLDESEEISKDESVCLLSISVGQQTHEGAFFSSTVDLVNEQFQSCAISLYDSLQRHTMALRNGDEKVDTYYPYALKEGELWIERNEKYLSKLKNLKAIYRWDSWLNHPEFKKYHTMLKELLEQDSIYRKIFHQTIDNYLNKYCAQLSNTQVFDKERAWKTCANYVLEECAVFCIWPELNCDYEAYPGVHNNAIIETRRRFVLIQDKQLLKPLMIKFRNAPQLSPQRFVTLEDACLA